MILFTVIASMIAGWKGYNITKWSLWFSAIGMLYILGFNAYLYSIEMLPLMSGLDLALNGAALLVCTFVFHHLGAFLRRKIRANKSYHETYYESDDEPPHSGK